MGHLGARIQRAADDAVTTLHDVARDDQAPPSSRISAAKTILDIAYRSLEQEDLALRMDALEAQVKM